MTLEEILHPVVTKAALKQFQDGHYRDSMVNAIIAAFDLMRTRTGLDLDGSDLANRVFSEQRPHLIVGDLETESGRNAQLGAMLFARGLYQGVRNPAAHSIAIVGQVDAARYLVAASALAQIIDDADHGDVLRFDGVYVHTDDEDGQGVLRFFPSGKVLSVSIGLMVEGTNDDDWVPDWLTLNWAEWQKQPISAFELTGNRLKFVTSLPKGEITYDGHVRGPKLRLRVHSTITNRGGENDYQFRPYHWGASR